ncbi:hypothetical protein HDU98_000466 [Podochytrium sp. JEL0797]|nr:hypothetical protein HDU98_000466 [Podochytrium sp. JEL0797]
MIESPQPAAGGSTQQQTNNGNGGGGGGTNTAASAAAASSKEARIHARKVRIEAARLAKMKPGKTDELVTNIRVGIVARESQRRFDDLKKQDTWSKKRLEDSTKSTAMHETISSQWSNILAKKNPYELNELLLAQREACDGLMASKNRLINEYMVDLKAKDDDYVKELKRQAEEIDTLIERMEEQYRSLQTSLKEELEHIEKSFIEERTELIENNLKETEALFSQRRDNEGKYLEERSDRIEDHTKQLEALRVRDAEEYNLVKIKLETDVQVLEQQLQQMRATYQLNTEKLEYNFQVLKKREEENASILSTQKRKIARLTDHLNLLKSKMTKQERVFQQEYVSLTDDYKRIMEQYEELRKKYRHFQVSDGGKFVEIWNMNEEGVRVLMRKVIAADRIIVEQQLGMRWQGLSEEELFKPVNPEMFRRRGRKSEDDNVATLISGDHEHAVGGGGAPVESLAAKFKETKMGGNATIGYSKTMKKMLELLCNEAGFLVEEKLQKLLAPLHRDEQSLMKLDSIFKALGVETVEDIEKLTSFFVARDASTVAARMPSPEGIVKISSQLIHPNDVIRAIRKFVEDHRPDKAFGGKRDHFVIHDEDTTDVSGDESNADRTGDELTKSETEGHGAGKPVKSRNDQQRIYWERMANVIDDKSYRVWTAVYVAMKKYNALLTERYQLTEDIDAVRSQSEELKGLLRQYMSAKVNDELQIPPTQIMWHAAGGGGDGHD